MANLCDTGFVNIWSGRRRSWCTSLPLLPTVVVCPLLVSPWFYDTSILWLTNEKVLPHRAAVMAYLSQKQSKRKERGKDIWKLNICFQKNLCGVCVMEEPLHTHIRRRLLAHNSVHIILVSLSWEKYPSIRTSFAVSLRAAYCFWYYMSSRESYRETEDETGAITNM